ncbi:MAG TPA: beta-L-arabinofuranosidase domain-containing protein, partial [Bacteroidales bacterium]|nr:beta-L-arabinofuranosidase domain-containing protein [Bacteroidales bacterium]
MQGVTGYAQTDLYPSTFHLRDVRLLEGPFRHAQELNVSVLLKYDVDRLLAPYRKEAGLPPKAESFPNWLGLDGHILGHYLSAMAIHYASTGKPEFRERMEYIVAELKACQIANGIKHPDWGVGYVGGVPHGKGLWPEIKAGNTARIWDYWVPWYNVHKTFEGLKDAWYYGGSEDALKVFLKFCDWAINLTSGLTDTQMEAMLANEHGGMNEVLAHAYKMISEDKYLVAAKRFSHKYLLNPMAEGIDMLENLHANTQIPK